MQRNRVVGRLLQMLALYIFLATALAACGSGVSTPSSTVEASYCAQAGPVCQTPDTIGPPGGLSRDAAIAEALRYAPSASGQIKVVRAQVVNNPFMDVYATAQPPVWVVRLEGSFSIPPCTLEFLQRPASPSDRPCMDQASGLVVVIDYFSGKFLGWAH
jgi:hypothetical protein